MIRASAGGASAARIDARNAESIESLTHGQPIAPSIR
jgi:hypothetical protein